MEVNELFELEEVEQKFDPALRWMVQFAVKAVKSMPESWDCVVLMLDARPEYEKGECPAPTVGHFFATREEARSFIGEDRFLRKFLDESPATPGIPTLHLIVVGGPGQPTQCVRLIGIKRRSEHEPVN